MNEKYFDVIDSKSKAYWLGFIWGDGYVCFNEKRYDFKLSLSNKDFEHLVKFKNELVSTHPIKIYNVTSSFGNIEEARLYICNKHFVHCMYNNYGIISRRQDFNKIIELVPNIYYIDLIRGILDSDGVISIKQLKNVKEFSVGFIGSISVLNFINRFLIDNNYTKTTYKLVKRHKDRDGTMFNIRITGNNIVYKFLYDVYVDNEEMSLKRKYDSFIEINKYILEYIKQPKLNGSGMGVRNKSIENYINFLTMKGEIK